MLGLIQFMLVLDMTVVNVALPRIQHDLHLSHPGLACLVTLAVRQAAEQIRHGLPAALAATHGYTLAFRIGAVMLATGGVLVLLERVTAQPRNPAAELTRTRRRHRATDRRPPSGADTRRTP